MAAGQTMRDSKLSIPMVKLLISVGLLGLRYTHPIITLIGESSTNTLSVLLSACLTLRRNQSIFIIHVSLIVESISVTSLCAQ